MISQLSGRLTGSNLILKSGIGFKITHPYEGDFEFVTLYVHTVYSDKDIKLYGFQSEKELNLFLALIKINKVGAQTAMNILSTLGYDLLVSSLKKKDIDAFKIVKRLPNKLAIQILNDINLPFDVDIDDQSDYNYVNGVFEALKSLGYSQYSDSELFKKIQKEAEFLVKEDTPSDKIEQIIIKRFLKKASNV